MVIHWQLKVGRMNLRKLQSLYKNSITNLFGIQKKVKEIHAS